MWLSTLSLDLFQCLNAFCLLDFGCCPIQDSPHLVQLSKTHYVYQGIATFIYFFCASQHVWVSYHYHSAMQFYLSSCSQLGLICVLFCPSQFAGHSTVTAVSEVTFPTGNWPDTVLERLRTNFTSVSHTLNIHSSDSKTDSYTGLSHWLIYLFIYFFEKEGQFNPCGRERVQNDSVWIVVFNIFYICFRQVLFFTVVEQW